MMFSFCWPQLKKMRDEDLAILLVTFLGWLSDLLERLSDLQLGDKKVTLNHLGFDNSIKRFAEEMSDS